MRYLSFPPETPSLPDVNQETLFNFTLRPDQEAQEPPEMRGLSRDQVRLMVSYSSGEHIAHTRFPALLDFLQPGDLLVINTSGTMNAALHAADPKKKALELHLSTHLPADLWVIELRLPEGNATLPYYEAHSGQELTLPGGGHATLHTPYRLEQRRGIGDPRVRLWVATVEASQPLGQYLDRYGFPIRYKYMRQAWPLGYYQTVFARERGSSEMPSAGRPFTRALVDQLKAKGVQIRPILLHTGVSSLENHEPPYEEYYRVPPETARAVNQVRSQGRRVIAVGTTVVRALETAAREDGQIRCGEGYTSLVITPERGVRAVNGLLTGLQSPAPVT
jgi:S-adenosylmethionine:tRNA ribosyltransferase-isomerase